MEVMVWPSRRIPSIKCQVRVQYPVILSVNGRLGIGDLVGLSADIMQSVCISRPLAFCKLTGLPRKLALVFTVPDYRTDLKIVIAVEVQGARRPLLHPRKAGGAA